MTLHSHEVRVDARVIRELRRLPHAGAERLVDAIESLAKEPRPKGTKKLVG